MIGTKRASVDIVLLRLLMHIRLLQDSWGVGYDAGSAIGGREGGSGRGRQTKERGRGVGNGRGQEQEGQWGGSPPQPCTPAPAGPSALLQWLGPAVTAPSAPQSQSEAAVTV